MTARLTTAEIGRCAENAVCSFLLEKQYTILHRNYAVARIGELDLVARKGGRLMFIEVKGRVNDQLGGPFAAITVAKRLRLRKTAKHYLKHVGIPDPEMNNEIIFLAAGVLLDDHGTVRKMQFEPLDFP